MWLIPRPKYNLRTLVLFVALSPLALYLVARAARVEAGFHGPDTRYTVNGFPGGVVWVHVLDRYGIETVWNIAGQSRTDVIRYRRRPWYRKHFYFSIGLGA